MGVFLLFLVYMYMYINLNFPLIAQNRERLILKKTLSPETHLFDPDFMVVCFSEATYRRTAQHNQRNKGEGHQRG